MKFIYYVDKVVIKMKLIWTCNGHIITKTIINYVAKNSSFVCSRYIEHSEIMMQ